MKRFGFLLVVFLVVAGLALTGCARKKTETAKGTELKRIHFDFDKSNIKPEYEETLKGNAKWLQSNSSKNVAIEGHCDERGSNEYNMALGDRRANSTKRYLQNLGVAAGRMNTVSYGEERPISNCHNESCWSQNRRAEFLAK